MTLLISPALVEWKTQANVNVTQANINYLSSNACRCIQCFSNGIKCLWCHLARLAILDPVHLGGKYPGPLPCCSWMTCKRGQSPRYLQPFHSSNNRKFPTNTPLCPDWESAGVYIDWCIRVPST